MHDNVVKEERFVVDFDVSRQKAAEVSHIPADKLKITQVRASIEISNHADNLRLNPGI